MNATTIKSFPAYLVDAAREALAKAHKRMVRAAARQGQDAPAAPTLVASAERAVSRCNRCGAVGGFVGLACESCGAGSISRRLVVDLEIAAERPKLDGWEFLAVVEPLDGGNLLRAVPGAVIAEGELAGFRSCEIACDHCKARRRRSETFVVRGCVEDGRMATLLQVGRQCLAAFLGGKSAAAIVARLDWAAVVSGAGEEAGSGGRGEEALVPAEVLAWASASVRLAGWCSRGAAEGGDRTATADHVSYLLTPPWGSEQRAEWERDRAEYRPTADDIAKGEAALAWARALAPASDYEQNLSLVARQEWARPKHLGILCSAVSAYERAQGRAVQLANRAKISAASGHVGEVGKRVAIKATVERVTDVETQYGALHIHSLRDADGNALVWKTGSKRLEVGSTVDGKATIKAHTEFRGEKQTELSRVS